ncbi:hypothetical protein [Chitinophaga arvensicola]|uniref:Uncharacterized protein n=1 Tax=Chitinophaga arvensicola TaxID=29529 RepID=A0A1I0S9I1_9BACT|nr:hypothetical protein [Chitinophaga arvensicola]SEW52707.1 hypothetical protein SAMN04488122_5047 [Chitinophaga arvensicola]
MKKLFSLSFALLTCIALLMVGPAQATMSKHDVTVKVAAKHALWYLRNNWVAPGAAYSPLMRRGDGGLAKIVVMVGTKNVCQGNYQGDIWADSNIGTPAFIFWNCPSGMSDERYFYPGDFIMVEILSGITSGTSIVQKTLTQADIDGYLIYMTVPGY